LRDAARVLTWQEFEKFAEECLIEAGFQTEKNVRVKGDGRAWQIDVVGFRGDLVLAIDCKSWNTPGYLSRFKLAAEHQRTATLHLLAMLLEKTIQGDKERRILPVILTLSEPPARLSQGVVLVSVEKLPSFLTGVTPYDKNLPFLSSSQMFVENPMSQAK
jgi:Restriction endonuclease